MSGQMIFFRKNWADYEKSSITITASEGQDSAYNVIDRSNRSAWGTSGSTDASNTTFEIDCGDVGTIDSILLLKHNFKNFTIKYWDEVGLAWTDFSPAINVTNNTAESSFFEVTQVLSSKFLMTITGTQVANAEKFLYQFIVTSKIGRLTGWPIFKGTTLARNLTEQQTIAGKRVIIQNVGYYATTLNVANWSNPTDLTTVEYLFFSTEGFLFWPCGGNETQFSSVRRGYRLEDIYLCRCRSEFNPDWKYGLYKGGMEISIDLIEVVT